MLLSLLKPSNAPKFTLESSSQHCKVNVCSCGHAVLQTAVFIPHLKILTAREATNCCRNCWMFGPDCSRSPWVSCTGRSKGLMIAKSPETEAIIGKWSQRTFSIFLSLKASAWPQPSLDDSQLSAFGPGQSFACLPRFWSFWWNSQCAMWEVRSWLFWQFGWRLSPGSSWNLSVGLAFALWETSYYLMHNLE